MNAILSLAFEDHLVRIVDRAGEPWFVGKDVCTCLEIRNHNDALKSLDEDERAEVGIADPSGTKYATAISEPGVYRLVFRSRKAEAERFKRWLAHEVIPSLRKTGRYEAVPSPSDPVVDLELIKAAPLAARVDAIRVAARLYGRPRARLLWEVFGLPPVPFIPEPVASDAARAVLAQLLDFEIEGNTLQMPIRSWLAEAAGGFGEAVDLLAAHGLKLYDLDGREGFLVANSHRGFDHLLSGRWSPSEARDLLRSLPGARLGLKTRFGERQSRATWLPARFYEAAATVNHPGIPVG